MPGKGPVFALLYTAKIHFVAYELFINFIRSNKQRRIPTEPQKHAAKGRFQISHKHIVIYMRRLLSITKYLLV